MRILNAALIVGLCGGLASSLHAAAGSEDADWPCIQRKIPTLSLGMMWAGPAPEEDPSAWTKDTELMQLSDILAIRRTDLDHAAGLIDSYSSRLAVPDRNLMLTRLVAAVLENINAERRSIINGIERYTKKQQALADSVRQTRAQFEEALDIATPSEADDKNRRDLEQKLLWQTRIHDEREKSLKYVCEAPVLLEQRAFAIAREIANHLTE